MQSSSIGLGNNSVDSTSAAPQCGGGTRHDAQRWGMDTVRRAGTRHSAGAERWQDGLERAYDVVSRNERRDLGAGDFSVVLM
jgi:hypothetical protein